MRALRVVKPGSTIQVRWPTYNAAGASVTMTGLAVTDVEIYKGSSTTQRASDNGVTLVDTDGIDIDGQTGFHGFSIDLADNSDAGFFAAGQEIWVYVNSVTVDSQTVAVLADHFYIGYAGAILDTTIATLSSQTSFTLTSGPAEDDALNGLWLIVHDVASAVQQAIAIVSDYTGSTKTVALVGAPTFTIAATDNICVMGLAPLQPTVTGRTLDVTATGAGGVDWANVENQSTSVNLSATTTNLVNTLTTYTGNTPQTGDSFARLGAPAGASVSADILTIDNFVDDLETRLGTPSNLGSGATIAANLVDIEGQTDDIGTAGAGLTALGDTRLANLDAAVTTRMATYTQPAGFLATTFPGGTVANTTNITAGTITTVTNLTNAATSGDLTATMKTSVNTEVLDVLNVDTFAEVGQESPAATQTIRKMLAYLYKFLRNKKTQTSTTLSIFADDTTTVDQKSTVSDDGTTLTTGEFTTGP